MRIDFKKITIVALAMMLSSNSNASDAELESLRSALNELRSDYESRIAALEQRLLVAEQNATQAASNARPATAEPSTTTPSVVANTAFNPAIGVVFEGQAWNHSGNPDDYTIPGFPLGGEAGLKPEGLGLGELELIMNANVDDKFSGWLTAAIALEDGEAVVELEEAWVEATALPAGLNVRFGRFFSDIGYLNAKHTHAWDFADQPLPYQAFLANQYIDTGLQLRWLAPTSTYLEFGAELFQGDRYPAAGSAHSGAGTYTAFVNTGGDVGTSHSWLAGVSYLDASAIDRPSGDEDDPLLFTGDSRVSTAQFVWKWAPRGNWKERNLTLQAEYLQRRENGTYIGSMLTPAAYDVDQSGWYLQAVYQPIRRWRIGARFDSLDSDDPGVFFAGSPLAATGDDPRRVSLMADWSNSEFSRLRLQFAREDSGSENYNQWGIQYIHSIGAHGAHSF